MPYTTLRFPGRCTTCAQPVPANTRAWWDPGTRHVTCAECVQHTKQVSTVRALAEARQQSYAADTRRTWGRFAGLVLALRPADQETRLAQKGAAGEERLTVFLNKVAAKSAGPVVVLHDRAIPGRRENLDHLVVTTAGIWAVDAKAYSGQIKVPWLRRHRLIIGGRDQRKLLDQSRRQQQFLTDAKSRLGIPAQVPVFGALCFLDADMAPFANGARVEDVLIATPRKLKKYLRQAGSLTPEQVRWVADRLNGWFTPAR